MGTRSAKGNSVDSVAFEIANVLDASDTGTSTVNHSSSLTRTYTNGTSDDQIDRVWVDKGRALASGVSEDIDLFDFASQNPGAGAGDDALGQAMALAEIVELWVENDPTSDGDLVIGATAGNAWTSFLNAAGTMTLPPRASIRVSLPADPAYAVADGSNHLLQFEASGGNVVYNIHAIAGRSA